jgi:hypothetical protein
MDDAVAAALDRIRRAAVAHRRAKAQEARTREGLHSAIVEAFEVGARPVEVEQVSPYDRNHNARLRAAAKSPSKPASRRDK